MRLIAHISDLHFGRHDAAVTEGLLADIAAQRPDLIVISGDFTQRARHREFAAARDFLGKLAAPVIAVPGNHDVPLYDLARRAFRPLKRFARYITDAEQPFFADAEVAVLGISTARSMTIANGRISHRQMDEIRRLFAEIGDTVFRILVTHHPLIAPPHAPERAVVGRAEPALTAIADAGVELLLTGHTHETFTGDLIARPLSARRSILVSQAGTAISTRRREEVNSYNLIGVAAREVAYEHRAWEGERFATASTQRYAKNEERWTRKE
jgi:3',5'-cyclic AMP phosphodiesterase CpdA